MMPATTQKLTLVLRVLSSVFIITGCGLPLGSVGSNPLKYTPGVTYKYLYTTQTTLNDDVESKRQVGFLLSATVQLTPIWTENEVSVVKIEVLEPRLNSVSRDQMGRQLLQLSRSPIYFQWHGGHVVQVLASDDETVLSLNLKRGIISVLQLSPRDGDTAQSEIDVSGNCLVLYDRPSQDELKKSKSSCSSLDPVDQSSRQSNELFGVNKTFSSLAQYTLSNDVIKSVTVDETFVGKLNIERSLSPTVLSRQQLKLLDMVDSKSLVQAPSLDVLLKKLGKDKKGRFYSTVLPATHEAFRTKSNSLSAEQLVAEHRTNIGGQHTGTVQAVNTFVKLVNGFRKADKETIARILNDRQNAKIILPLIDVATAAQTLDSQAALMNFIKFTDENHLERAERYLLAVAMSTHPAVSTITDLMRLFQQDSVIERLSESVGDALGAVTNTYRKMNANQQKIVAEVETAFKDKLEKCGVEETCLLTVVRAIGNARLPSTLNLLAQLALTSKHASVSEASLNAISKQDSAQLSSSDVVNDVVRTIFLQQGHRAYDTAVRSRALLILLSLTTLSAKDIQYIVTSSLDPWNTDYNMYIQACVLDAAKRNDNIRFALKQVLSNSTLANYHVLAPKGKSLAFTSDLAATDDFTASYHMFVENGRSGIMKRSGMDVDVTSSAHRMPVYSFKMYSAGLESLLGEEVDESEKDIEATAGLRLDLLGVSLRPVSFFTGQSGLMSALWNAPSELTPALQTHISIQDLYDHFVLQNGLIVHLNVTGAISVGLEGSLSVSLWNKNAKSLIKNRGALQLSARLSLSSSSFDAAVECNANMESVIDFSSDVDFSDGVITCLQMSRPSSQFRIAVTKTESGRGFKTSYRSHKVRSKNINPISYPLPRRNNENCRQLLRAS